jgi:cyanate permease
MLVFSTTAQNNDVHVVVVRDVFIPKRIVRRLGEKNQALLPLYSSSLPVASTANNTFYQFRMLAIDTSLGSSVCRWHLFAMGGWHLFAWNSERSSFRTQQTGCNTDNAKLHLLAKASAYQNDV